ncbi:hypothetical protein F66182_11756, partial [Fusarium sp. NRRL 66182]
VHPSPTVTTNDCLAGLCGNIATTTGRHIYPNAEYSICTAKLVGIKYDSTAKRTTTSAIHPGPAGATDNQLAGSTGSITGTTGPTRTSGNRCASIRCGSTDSVEYKPTTILVDGNASATFSRCVFACYPSSINMARGSSSISSGGAFGNACSRTANTVRRTTRIKLFQCNVQRRSTDQLPGSTAILQNFRSRFIRGALDVTTLWHGFTGHATSCDAVSVDVV